MGYFDIIKYNDNLYQIRDALGVLSTLVIGKEKALLLDTGYGIGNLYEEVKKITIKPLIVINSHGHMDHSCGNYLFKEVWINKKDYRLLEEHNSKEWRENNIVRAKKMNVLPSCFKEDEYLNAGCGNILFLKEQQTFDLGSLECEVIAMEGHTQGSIGIYIKAWSLLLVGDATCPFVWLFLDESTTVSQYTKMLERVLKIPFTSFLVGHGARMFPKSKMEQFLNIASTIDISKAVKVSFEQFEHLNSYCYTLGQMYDQNDCGIIFNPNKM